MGLKEQLSSVQSQFTSEIAAKVAAESRLREEQQRKSLQERARLDVLEKARAEAELKELHHKLSASGIEEMVKEITDYANENRFYRGRTVNFYQQKVSSRSFLDRLKGEVPQTVEGPAANIEVGQVGYPARLDFKFSSYYDKAVDFLRPQWEAKVGWGFYSHDEGSISSGWGHETFGTSRVFRVEGFKARVTNSIIEISLVEGFSRELDDPYGKILNTVCISANSDPQTIRDLLISAYTGKLPVPSCSKSG